MERCFVALGSEGFACVGFKIILSRFREDNLRILAASGTI